MPAGLLPAVTLDVAPDGAPSTSAPPRAPPRPRPAAPIPRPGRAFALPLPSGCRSAASRDAAERGRAALSIHLMPDRHVHLLPSGRIMDDGVCTP